MKTFEQYIHEQGTGAYPLATLLYNLEPSDIEEMAQGYAKELVDEKVKEMIELLDAVDASYEGEWDLRYTASDLLREEL